jgi:hypothetical protein
MENKKRFVSILWTEDNGKTEADVKLHDTLREAALYLIKNGANYKNQEIAQLVDWIPSEEQKPITPAGSNVTKIKDPVEAELAQRPNPTGKPLDQPQVMDFTRPKTPSDGGGKKSIFDGVIPPQLRGPLLKDD